MGIIDDLEVLSAQLRTMSSGVRAELGTFPSGAAMLDVKYRDRLFVLAYSPTDGFGVDEVEEDVVGLGTSFRHNYNEFASAKEKLRSIVEAAIAGEIRNPPEPDTQGPNRQQR